MESLIFGQHIRLDPSDTDPLINWPAESLRFGRDNGRDAGNMLNLKCILGGNRNYMFSNTGHY